jgi:hypothetical protein
VADLRQRSPGLLQGDVEDSFDGPQAAGQVDEDEAEEEAEKEETDADQQDSPLPERYPSPSWDAAKIPPFSE